MPSLDRAVIGIELKILNLLRSYEWLKICCVRFRCIPALSFAVAMDPVVDMGLRLGDRLEASYFGQDMDNQVMHSNCMDPKPSLTLEQNFAY